MAVEESSEHMGAARMMFKRYEYSYKANADEIG